MNKAIELACKKFDIDIREFTVVGKKTDGTLGHYWYVGTDDNVDEQSLMTFIDETLCEINDDYPVERKHALRDVNMKVLKTKLFINLWSQKVKRVGKINFHEF